VVVTITSVTAVLGKYIFRSRSANLFNPAALAIIASFYVFHTGQSWWGAPYKPTNRIYISQRLGWVPA